MRTQPRPETSPMPLGRRSLACILLLASVAACALAGGAQPQPQPPAQRKPGEEEEPILQAAKVLFNYLPHADEPALEEEVLASIGKLTVHGGKVDPLLMAALKGPSAEKRAAAAYILGQRGDPSLRELVRPLLADEDPTIQHY